MSVPGIACISAACAIVTMAFSFPGTGESSTGRSQRAMPIVIQSDSDLSPCDSLGEITHLDPNGDNFLSVQSGPGGKPYTETDRLQPGKRIYICGEHGMWFAVVYGKTEDEDCRLSRPKQKTYAYRGPCRFGWVYKRYVTVVAG